MSYMCFWSWQDAWSPDSLVPRFFPIKLNYPLRGLATISLPSIRHPGFIWRRENCAHKGLAMTSLRVTTFYRLEQKRGVNPLGTVTLGDVSC